MNILLTCLSRLSVNTSSISSSKHISPVKTTDLISSLSSFSKKCIVLTTSLTSGSNFSFSILVPQTPEKVKLSLFSTPSPSTNSDKDSSADLTLLIPSSSKSMKFISLEFMSTSKRGLSFDRCLFNELKANGA